MLSGQNMVISRSKFYRSCDGYLMPVNHGTANRLNAACDKASQAVEKQPLPVVACRPQQWSKHVYEEQVVRAATRSRHSSDNVTSAGPSAAEPGHVDIMCSDLVLSRRAFARAPACRNKQTNERIHPWGREVGPACATDDGSH